MILMTVNGTFPMYQALRRSEEVRVFVLGGEPWREIS